jgi:diketogulonate reductase-like aldo/keto reductase
MLYGTAWKEDDTKRLVELALSQGFRGIDTANQRKHYFERAVGEGIKAAIQKGPVQRDDLFLQTKFTFQRGQDHRLPYDPEAPIEEQVEQSLAKSLEHLNVTQLDSYVLHGPSVARGLGPADWEAWRAMEAIHRNGTASRLGVSNVSAEQLSLLCSRATVLPCFVQNRCYAIRGWDYEVRRICKEHNIVYQGFSLLTANQRELGSPLLRQIASRHSLTPQQTVFRFAIHVGMLPLTGTTSAEHMKQDLAVFNYELDTQEVNAIETISMR